MKETRTALKRHDSQLLMARRLAGLAGVLIIGGIATGCTHDFDQFESSGAGRDMQVGDGMMPDGITPVDGVMTTDLAPGVDATTLDMGDMPTSTLAAPGEECVSHDACASDVCVEGVCAATCDEQGECAQGEACEAIDAERSACLVACAREGDACEVGGRSGMTCVRAVGAQGGVFTASFRTYLTCSPDEDLDAVADGVDNCVSMANPTQEDRDGDGIGDACEAAKEVSCLPGGASGKRVLAGIPWEGDDVDVAHMLDGEWLVLQGGKNDRGELQRARVRVDRKVWSHEKLPDNLYAAHDMESVTYNGEHMLVMPGAATERGRQVGRFLDVDRAGQIEQGLTLTQSMYRPVIGRTRDGVVMIAAYIDAPEVVVGPRLRVWRYRGGAGALEEVLTVVTQGRVRLNMARSATGGVRVYTGADALDGMMQGPQKISRTWSFTRLGQFVASENLSLPNSVEPIYFETRGGFELVLDRISGASYRIDRNGDFASMLELPDYGIERDVKGGDFVSLPESFGVILVGNDDEQIGTLKLTEYDFLCRTAIGTNPNLDKDTDGVDDRVDNCMTLDNPMQEDADGDGQGDACDEDADDDGVPNMLDVMMDSEGMVISLALDTDNDGIPNVDDPDDDNDGVLDVQDRMPLDSDNDGVSNRDDLDDDNDGSPDTTEQAFGTDPYHPLDYPGVGRISVVRRGAGDVRTVTWGKVSRLDAFEAVAFPSGSAPHQPRFSQTGQSLVALDGAPGEATEVIWSQIENPAEDPFVGRSERFPLEIGALKAAAVTTAPEIDPVAGESAQVFHVVNEREAGVDLWNISQVSAVVVPGATMRNREVLRDDYAMIEDLYWSGGRLYFIGAPTMCEACASVYSMQTLARGDVRSELERVYGELWGVRRASNALVTVGAGEVFYGAESIALPSGVEEVNSAVALGGAFQIVISARSMDGSYDLWHFNGTMRKWVQLTRESDDLIELDWKP